jgi:hypothetical protein
VKKTLTTNNTIPILLNISKTHLRSYIERRKRERKTEKERERVFEKPIKNDLLFGFGLLSFTTDETSLLRKIS